MDVNDNFNCLEELWKRYKLRKSHLNLRAYLEEFIKIHQHILEDFFHNDETNKQKTVQVSKNQTLLHLPPDFVQVAQNLLIYLQDSNTLEENDLMIINCLVQTLAIMIRIKREVQLLQTISTNIVGFLLVISSNAVSQLRNLSLNLQKQHQVEMIEDFLRSAFYFFAIFYDPISKWKSLINKRRQSANDDLTVPLINSEVIPFFYETLQVYNNVLSNQLQLDLLHMFGAILCGRDGNAQLATSATTLEILQKYLSLYIGTNQSTDEGDQLKQDFESIRLVLKLIIKMIHTLHKAGPDQCQLKVAAVLKKFFKILSQTDHQPSIQLQMIRVIPDILDVDDKIALQTELFQLGCFNQLKNVLTNICETINDKNTSEQYAIEFINVMTSLVTGSVVARDVFCQHFSNFLLSKLQRASIPTSQVFVALVNMTVESCDGVFHSRTIKNIFIAKLILEWLPDIKQEQQQVWLSSLLSHLFTSSISNMIIAMKNRIITDILDILMKHQTLFDQTVYNLIEMMEKLGSYSMSPLQTSKFIEILRQDSEQHQHMNKYFNRLLSSLGAMAYKELTDCKPAFFFDLQDESAGITIPAIKKWSGPAFCVHTWVCVHYSPNVDTSVKRKQLYSFYTEQGTGVEAFFTVGCQLVVAVATKKTYLTVALNEFPLVDNKWHCIQIVHQPSRKMFGLLGGTVSILIDGSLKLTTALRVPSFGSGFNYCSVGSSAHQNRNKMINSSGSISYRNNNNSSNLDRVVTIESGNQHEIWGPTTSLHGQLGSFILFNEPLKDHQLQALYNAGLDLWQKNRHPETLFCEIPHHKVVIHFEAKACSRHMCKDLSHSNPPLDGRLTGIKIDTWDIKDAINCIGGLPMLTPLLEVINSRFLSSASHDDVINLDSSLDSELSANVQMYATNLLSSDYIQANGRSRRVLYPTNPLANYFSVLNSFVTSGSRDTGWHVTNAEAVVNCQLFATLGALLQKLPVSLLNLEFLASVQNLATSCLCSGITPNSNLILDLYQFIIFDFRIWCLTASEVQYSHVQYLSTLIKEDKKVFRARLGVQYFLDVIKTYYCLDPDTPDSCNIRHSLLSLIKFYVTDDVTSSELSALLSFVSLSNNSHKLQACEVMELMKSILYCSSRNQFINLMIESSFAKRLYTMLGMASFEDEIRVSVLQLIAALFKTPQVADKHIQMLRATSVGFHGIVWLMADNFNSNQLSNLLLDITKATDYDGASFMAVLQVVASSDRVTKRRALEVFIDMAYSKSTFLADCTKQKSWQETIVMLLTVDLSKDDCSSDTGIISSPPSVESLDRLTEAPSTTDSISSSAQEEFVLVDRQHSQRTLLQLIVESIFLLMWRGVRGSSRDSWKERVQIFTCLDYVTKPFMCDVNYLKLLILHDCIEAAHSDVRELSVATTTSQKVSFASASENAAELIRIIYYFLTDQSHQGLWSDHSFVTLYEQLMMNVYAIYDAMLVWEYNSDSSVTSSVARGTEWKELAAIGICLLVGCLETGVVSLLAIACAKLHNLIHSRSPESSQEVFYLLHKLHCVVKTSIADSSDMKDYVIPIIRGLLSTNISRLQLCKLLPQLPTTNQNNPTFYESFINYCLSPEWISFMATNVFPKAKEYERKSFSELKENMKKFWAVSHQMFMVSSHFGLRAKGDAKLCFQDHFQSDFVEAQKLEEDRQMKNFKSLSNQHTSILRQWRSSKRFLSGDRSPWCERNPIATRWKLSNVENFSRMRLKLTQNYNFDSHDDASRLRDNLAPAELTSQSTKSKDTLVPPNAVLTSSDNTKDDDGIGDEDWNMLAANVNVASEAHVTKEKLIMTSQCELITLMDVVEGRLEVTSTHVYFYDKTNEEDEVESGLDFKWSLSQLREVHLRRFNLRKSAVELFLVDQTNYFINFSSTSSRLATYKALLSTRPPNLLYYGSRTPQELLKISCITQKWVQREISNFDYLMQLNTIAGRTYNDLSQYPVFPWILKDYTSEKLDLEDPEVYRDLSRPMGVQNPKNDREVKDRYDQFEDPQGVIKKFHFGSHYSNAASVLFYLLRLEPFTTLHINLQGGRFDLADRQFHSIASTYAMLYGSSSDVKELIPEFFYMPDFLVNSNRFDLGKLQFSQESVDDVILPRWAKSPADFIHQHRQALESDHVSNNLHKWIDLIFGYKQRGQEAVEAMNVFYYCTYEGAVDLDAIEDEVQRKAVEGMINNFGQTPTQLLRDPHPARMSRDDVNRRVSSRIVTSSSVSNGDVSVFDSPNNLRAFSADIMENEAVVMVTVPRNQSHSFIQSGMPDVMVTISENGIIGCHSWLPWGRQSNMFEKDYAVGNVKLRKSVKNLFSSGLKFNWKTFVVTNDAKYIVVAGYWDNSIRVMTSRGKHVACLVRHLDMVTCLWLDYRGVYMMSGSYDSTCIIWKISTSGGFKAQPVHILHGHEDLVTCVHLNTELDVALSSSKDGTCIIHTARKGHYVRTIQPPATHPENFIVSSITMSNEGLIVVYTKSKYDNQEETKYFLHLYSINGKHLALDCLENHLGHMTIGDGYLVTGDTNGTLVIRNLFNFDEVSRLSLHASITNIFITKFHSYLLVSLKDGKLIIISSSIKKSESK